jgi:TolB-like protein
MALYSQCQTTGLSICGKGGAAWPQLPDPDGVTAAPTRSAREHQQENDSHVQTMQRSKRKKQVRAGCSGVLYILHHAENKRYPLRSMAAGEIPAEVVQEHLERVLASPGFARNERLSRFLRFIAQEELNGRGRELKESLIGVEVFGRKPGFDPKQDSTVRSEAARLRARLAEYYDDEGKSDTLVIELPKGGYIPRFCRSGPDVANAEGGHANRLQPWKKALAAGLALALAGFGFWLWNRGSRVVSIAVLPLTNLSPDGANDYFADGITDEIIRNVSILDGIAVRSQTSSFAFKGKPRNIREIGKQLDVDYILEGSILRAGQQLRINAQLVRVRDDFPLWSGRYDRPLTDVFAIQDELSRKIVNQLRLKLGRGRRRYETSVEAYDYFLRARALQNRGVDGRIASIVPFQQAIAKDSSFAPAYAGLAAAYVARSGEGARRPHDEEVSAMQAAAQKAIELDPLLAEAHAALGMTHARLGQWGEAEQRFRRAIELDASSSGVRSDFAINVLLPLGRVEEAVREMRAAERADPLSSQVHVFFGYVLLAAGRYNEAARECEQAAADYEVRNECLGRGRTQEGKLSDAISLLSNSPTNNWGYLAYAYGKAGRRAEAEKLMADAPTLYQNRRGPFQYALAFAGLGDKEQTIGRLESMANLGPVLLGRDLTYPEFALVRGDPRVKALRRKVGLPE